MRTQYLAILVLLGTLSSCTKETIDNTIISKSENIESLELQLLTVVNDHRTTIGQSVLEFSEVAYEYANEHTDYMISENNLNHDNFSSRASKIASQVNAVYVAENVARNYSTANGAFQGWLNSASHKKTMEGDFTHTAVSVKENSKGDYYFTQIFVKQ